MSPATEHLKREVFSLIGSRCAYCGSPDDVQVNHKAKTANLVGPSL